MARSSDHRAALVAAALLATAGPAFAQVGAPAQTPSTVTSGAPPATAPTGARTPPTTTAPTGPAAQTPSTVTSSTPPAEAPSAPAKPSRAAKGQGPGGHAPDGQASARVERRLAMLHKRLEITANEEQPWSVFAAAMRENAQHMDALYAERMSQGAPPTAVQQLTAYEHMTEAHMQDLQRLIPAFDALYGSFTPAQKQNADAIFRERAEHGKQAQHG